VAGCRQLFGLATTSIQKLSQTLQCRDQISKDILEQPMAGRVRECFSLGLGKYQWSLPQATLTPADCFASLLPKYAFPNLASSFLDVLLCDQP
jgi:hypothetical protein